MSHLSYEWTLDTKFNQADKGSFGLALCALFMNSPSLLHLQGQTLPSHKTDQHAKCLFLSLGHWHPPACDITALTTFCHDTKPLKILITNCALQTEEKMNCHYLWGICLDHKAQTHVSVTYTDTQSTNTLGITFVFLLHKS